jgi:SAM-dependent methyltransferase
MAFGLDRSGASVQLYNENLDENGAGCTGDVTKLPFADQSFDLVLLVTVLMYLERPADREVTVRELVRVARRGGKVIIVENNQFGTWPFALGAMLGRLLRRHTPPETAIAGRTFSSGEIPVLVRQSGARLVRQTGVPVFTNLLPFLLLLAVTSESLCIKALALCRAADRRLEDLTGISLYVCYELSPND